MPSSLIFTGLVVLWLLILVPAVARHQQEVARPSGASLAGRVLARPRRRSERRRAEEEDSVDDDDTPTVEAWQAGHARVAHAASARTDSAVLVESRSRWTDEPDPDADPDDDLSVDADDDRLWERPPPRYRPGRGGFDPDADAENARTRYAFRQRVVLALLVGALLTGVVAAAAMPVVWWAHSALDLALVTYLVYLRRQVRLETAIRERRATRIAGTRRTSAAEDRELDEWAHRGREATRHPQLSERPAEPAPVVAVEPDEEEAPVEEPALDEVPDGWAEDGDADRVRGAGEPVGLLPARRRGTEDGTTEPESALPRLRPAPPPPLPPGTTLVVVDDDDLDLYDLGGSAGAPHRSAVGE
jgi:hypothetical protein